MKLSTRALVAHASFAAVLSLSACSSSSASPATNGDASTPDTLVAETPVAAESGADVGAETLAVCPQEGIVIPDLRDVERSGEGLVTTTFGDHLDRTPLWPRATKVLASLKGQWSRSKALCPALPAAQVAMLDKAIVDLDAAIAATDQEKAVTAANAVGLAVPELFHYFKGDAPIEIVRLDAVFRQVGIDAHFKHFDAAKADIASMKADIASAGAAITARVPTCHRVAGTATVQGEITASFKAIDDALATSTVMPIEIESDNGALEIDTLELLFDCPPDGPPVGTGVGSTCKTTADCKSPVLVCDPANRGGICAPDPAQAFIGTPCANSIDCGDDARSACNTEAGDKYPGGYCFMEPCNDVDVCPPGATCVALGGESPGCFKSCKVDADCRVAEGYVCQLFVTAPPTGFGPSDHACAFKCTRDADCQAPLTCDVTAGKCKP